MPTYIFRGGPCDGRQTPFFATQPADQTIIQCGGASYIYYRANPGVFGWLDVGAGGGGGEGAGGAVHGQRQVGSAWHSWMQAMGHKMPSALNRSRAGRRAMRRAVR